MYFIISLYFFIHENIICINVRSSTTTFLNFQFLESVSVSSKP